MQTFCSVPRQRSHNTYIAIGVVLAASLGLLSCKSQQNTGGPPVAPVRTVTD